MTRMAGIAQVALLVRRRISTLGAPMTQTDIAPGLAVNRCRLPLLSGKTD
jgi:hypothetical protein